MLSFMFLLIGQLSVKVMLEGNISICRCCVAVYQNEMMVTNKPSSNGKWNQSETNIFNMKLFFRLTNFFIDDRHSL